MTTTGNNNRIFASFLISLALSCAPAGKISVKNISDEGLRQPGQILYGLPQTTIDVVVRAEYTQVTPGPYRQFAEKYLGLKDVPAKEENHCRITSVHLSSHVESDPDFIYSVEGNIREGGIPRLDRLIADSMVLDLSAPIRQPSFYADVPVQSFGLPFPDLSIKRYFEAEKDMAISVAMPDSGYAIRQAGKKPPKEKTLEQKAEEAADFLIKLRKRRFKLVSGQYDSMPEGVAMGDALAELSRLEERYLSLFAGKQTVSAVSRIFRFTPAVVKKTDRVVLFRFSDDEGFLDARDSKGKPVLLDMVSTGKTRNLESNQTPARESDNTLLYRIPDQVSFRLLEGELVLAENVIPVFQWGALVRMTVVPDNEKR
jgi:hypothetical protein